MIPRDGFSAVPKPPGTEWKSNPPEIPFWYKALTGKDKWVHLFGTASGQWDIFYGVIWGTRTAIKVGILIEFITLLLGILVGALSAFYGGWLDTLLQRITEIFMAFPFLMAALTSLRHPDPCDWKRHLAGNHCVGGIWLDGVFSSYSR